MKLRLNNDSVRFRVAPSGVKTLLYTGRLDRVVRFPAGRSLTYSIVFDETVTQATVYFHGDAIAAHVPRAQAMEWAMGDALGLTAEILLDDQTSLSLLIEKDLACLDRSDEDNQDTFPNPAADRFC